MWGGASCQGRVSWCVQHTIGDSGIWGSTWNYQGTLLVLSAGHETADFEEVVFRKVATLHVWVAVMIKTGDGKKRDNALHGDYLHEL